MSWWAPTHSPCTADHRYTGDLDIFVEPTKANARRIIAVLEAFGFGTVGLSAEDFTRPNRVAQLGYPPVRIDILTGISGVSFKEAWKGHLKTHLAGIELTVLGAREFALNKRAAARPKDLADLALLEEVQRAAKNKVRRASRRSTKRS